jgi:hypothetical protein
MGFRRSFRRSFAFSVVAGTSSVAGACSDTPSSGPVQTGGSSSGGAAGALAAAGGSMPSTGGGSSAGAGSSGAPVAMAGAAGSSGTKPGCPASLAEAFPWPETREPTCTQAGSSCDVPIDCSSGRNMLTLTCKDGAWESGAVGCDHPYDFCPETRGANGGWGPSVYCEDGNWQIEAYLRNLSDSTGPCPAESPEAEACYIGGGTGGGDRQHCGYPCSGESPTWTVLSCVGTVASAVWSSDGACN